MVSIKEVIKKSVCAIALVASALSAQADPTFSLSAGTTSNLAANPFFSATAAQLGIAVPTVTIGNLAVQGGPADVTYSYLGSEAGFQDKAFHTLPNTLLFTTPGSTGGAFSTACGICVSSPFFIANGSLPFQFVSPLGTINNGSNGAAEPNFGVWLSADATTAYLFFNDKGAGPDADFDDMIIKATLSVSKVPEPSTYAMLLAGLGIMGAVVRRRRS